MGTADRAATGPPLIIVAGTSPECYAEARLGVSGRWLWSPGGPVPTDSICAVVADEVGRQSAIQLALALRRLGYRRCAVASGVTRRGTAEYAMRGAWRAARVAHPDDIVVRRKLVPLTEGGE